MARGLKHYQLDDDDDNDDDIRRGQCLLTSEL